MLDNCLQHRSVRERPGVAVANEDVAARARFDEPASLERTDRLAHHAPTGTEPLGEFGRRREGGPWGERAADDVVRQLPDDVLVAARQCSVIEPLPCVRVNSQAAVAAQ